MSPCKETHAYDPWNSCRVLHSQGESYKTPPVEEVLVCFVFAPQIPCLLERRRIPWNSFVVSHSGQAAQKKGEKRKRDDNDDKKG